MTGGLYTLSMGHDFLEALLQGLVGRMGKSPQSWGETYVFLPTQRAAYELSRKFQARFPGRPIPHITAFDKEGDPADLWSPFDPPSQDSVKVIPPFKRQGWMLSLVQAYLQERHGHQSFAISYELAKDLLKLQDQLLFSRKDFASLGSVAPHDLAQHFQETREFLQFLEKQWISLLETSGYQEPYAYLYDTLTALGRSLEAKKGPGLVVVAGSSGSFPGTGQFMKKVSQMANGYVVVHGPCPGDSLDQDFPSSHPFYSLSQWVRTYGPPPFLSSWLKEPRENSYSTRCFFATYSRAQPGAQEGTPQRDYNLPLLLSFDSREEEALSLGLWCRESKKKYPKKKVGVVTGDVLLRNKLVFYLKSLGVPYRCSQGEALVDLPQGGLAKLLLEVMTPPLAWSSLLSLLESPLSFPRFASTLKQAFVGDLRKALAQGFFPPLPFKKAGGVLEQIKEKSRFCVHYPYLFSKAMEHLVRFLNEQEPWTLPRRKPLGGWVAYHRRLYQMIQEDPSPQVARRDPLVDLFDFLEKHGQDFPKLTHQEYKAFFQEAMQGHTMKETDFSQGDNPIEVLGILENRLMAWDRVALGGMNEGSWPRGMGHDAWLNQSMREHIGLPRRDYYMGLSAHDFAWCLSQKSVYLTRSLFQGGEPTIPSRFWQKIAPFSHRIKGEKFWYKRKMFHWKGGGLSPLPKKPSSDTPFTPPLEALPRRLSATDLTLLRENPCYFYLKKVLKFPYLELSDFPGPRDYGILIHSLLENLMGQPSSWKQWKKKGAQALKKFQFDPMIYGPWHQKTFRTLRWVFKNQGPMPETRLLEAYGSWTYGKEGMTPVRLCARADRIDLSSDGCHLYDYKTGGSGVRQKIHQSWQIPLEIFLLKRGGFQGIDPDVYPQSYWVWHLHGQGAGGEVINLSDLFPESDLERIYEEIFTTLEGFYRGDKPFTHPGKPSGYHGLYDHFARLQEDD